MTRKQELQPHRFSGVVEYQRDNGDIGAVILGCETQDDTVRDLCYYSHYYAGLGYDVTLVSMSGVCPECDCEPDEECSCTRHAYCEDSCWGYLGSEAALEDGKASLEWLEKNKESE